MSVHGEKVAARLMRSSARLSFNPDTAIDWDAPVDPDLYAAPPERLSLYGTPLWHTLSEQQRRELSRQEVASIASTGIWFEAILMQMLIRRVYDRDPATSRVQYAYTEVADECRHSVMFARLISRLGGSRYRPDRLARVLGKVLKATSDGSVTFAATLFVEELLDQMQREAVADDRLEPLIRAVSRIHVTEEARHIAYARAELVAAWARRSRLRRARCRWVLALTAYMATTRLIDPSCYAVVGLDPRVARRAARGNPVWRASAAWFARRAVATFAEAGLIGGPSAFLWRKAGLLPAGPAPARPLHIRALPPLPPTQRTPGAAGPCRRLPRAPGVTGGQKVVSGTHAGPEQCRGPCRPLPGAMGACSPISRGPGRQAHRHPP